tara:strand:- start:285 stop:971 length:687 start_codon:yes stop_codon:yes gene_type:complete
MENFRNWLGIIVIIISVISLVIVGCVIVVQSQDNEDYKFVFTSLLPLVGTWVGVVLAFYFGKENFEAASNRYERIFEKLSPDILDDIPVKQIMITKKTMVFKNWEDISNMTVEDTLKFLIEVDKSRLPILQNNSIKYIIHQSLLSKPLTQEDGSIKTNSSIKMSEFIKKDEIQNVISKIIQVNENEILENVRVLMTEDSNCKDVFVKDQSGNLVGWLTDTLILRYINS